jgi:DNA-binding CsgD family transcriptional regulator
LDTHTLDHSDIFSALERTYGLIDGKTRWTDFLDTVVGLAGLNGAALFLYECERGHSQLIETRGGIRPAAGPGNDIVLDDFLWRSIPGPLWSPCGEAGTARSLADSGLAERSDQAHAESYAVVDRDHTHILYLAFVTPRAREAQGRDTNAVLESLIPHLHRACRLKRSIQNNTLLQLVHPDRIATMGLPIELRLRRRFRLSKAEARVAKLLAEGLAPRIIADRLHVSIHTVRSQLQSIFQKTDTCRQAELTSLLLRETEIPAALGQTQPKSLDQQEQRPCL